MAHTSSIPISGFSVVYNHDKDSITLTRDNSVSIPVEKGSESDFLLRKDLLAAGVISAIKIKVHNPEVEQTATRTIDVALAHDHRLMRDTEHSMLKVDDYNDSNIFNGFYRVPNRTVLDLWIQNNEVPNDIAESLLEHPEIYKNSKLVLDNKQIEKFVELYLWGGVKIFQGHALGTTAAIPKLLASNWRHDKPVDMWELLFVKRFLPEALDWERLTVSEAAHAIARNRAALVVMHGSPKRGSRTKEVVRKLLAGRNHQLNEFKRISPDGLSWYMHFCATSEEHYTAEMLYNPFSNEVDPHVAFTAAYREFLLLASMEDSFDNSVAFLDKAWSYLMVDIYDYAVICHAIDNDIDPELILSTMNSAVKLA